MSDTSTSTSISTTINPDRLAELETLELARGGHDHFDDGHCAMEVVSWLADEGFTDSPQCASRVIRDYTIALNDRWSSEKRQELKPYLVRMIGTGSDGKDDARRRIATRYCAGLVVPWLRLASLDEHADALAALPTDVAHDELVRALRAGRDAASASWTASREAIKAAVLEELRKRELPTADAAAADAAAAAAAVAAAVAADAAVATTDAATAVAAAVAAAVAVAVTTVAAAAAAVAAAVAAAAAAAVAAAVAAAAAAAAAAVAASAASAVDDGRSVYVEVYNAVRAYYRENPLPVTAQIEALAADQDGCALELLDLLIDADETPAVSS